jgi:Cdc6-like AAA superfamily ATPase
MTIRQKIVAKNGRVEMYGDNLFKFITKDKVIDFSVVDRNESKLIMELFNRHFYCLANVTSFSNNNEEGKIFFLHIGSFYNLQRWGKTPVIISDEIKSNVEKKYVKGKETLKQVLEDNFKLSDGISSYFPYTSGKYYLAPDSDKEKLLDKEEIIEQEKQKKDTLVIYGREFYIYVSIQGEEFNEKLYVEKIGKREQNVPMMRLAEGTLEFFDHNSILSKKVKETLESTKGYLNLWNQYAEQEGTLLLDEVRKVGLISVNRDAVTYDSEGTHLPYSGLSKEAEELIAKDTYLLFSDDVPVYLADPEMTWSDYRILSKEANEKGYSVNKGVQVRVNKRKNGGFVIETEDGYIPGQKYVSLSILGDEAQISRREDARKRIAEGKSANPALGLILEGKLTEEIGAYSTRKKIMPLSSFVKDKIFKYEPTETQKKAIDIALNTPDIAIIQGPPGTGKTTVITAIIERLNELCDKRENVNGQVLITSFQHDAVRNVIERLKINSLPTIKFGKQERAGEEDLTRERVVEEWCEEYIAKLNQKNPELIETEKRNRLSKLHNMYLAYPGDKNALEFLYCAKEINTDVEIDKKISRLIEARSVTRNDRTSEFLILIRRLRTTKEGFIDDGADNADFLLQNLEDMGINQSIPENRKVFDILDEAAMCYGNEPSEELLSKLCYVKTYLLGKCVPKPSYKKDVPDEEISKIYMIINQSVKKHQDEKSAILADLLKELRTNRSEIEKSLEHYLFVYSATTQQSEGIEIKEAKGINRHSDEHPEYETVIVDEAARVSPADLMIPLAQAKKRIILVGDHRQLPHIYDEEVFERMRENGEIVEINNIKKSMFEYLLEKARELEKIDNVPRTIVLDAQYRMHPMLGEFLNEIFYKPHDERFASPLPAANYQQFISKKPLPLEWYDFPDKYGKEHKEGTSRVRDCEADFIVEKLEYYMNLEEGKELSYGVITFYSEQVKSIKRKLENKFGDEARRIRVGSVDAFQGMEFDVIFLSIVRSNDKRPMVRMDRESKPEPINYDYLEKYNEVDEKQIDKKSTEYKDWELYKDKVGMQNYGFLISENRLCVSLSRQKKLLIVVGNTEMFYKSEWGRVAEICVPGMKKLYELCKGENVIYDGQSESI